MSELSRDRITPTVIEGDTNTHKYTHTERERDSVYELHHSRVCHPHQIQQQQQQQQQGVSNVITIAVS